MKKFNDFLKRVDSMAPDPWIVDGVVQSRPTSQLGFMLGVAIGALLIYIFS